MTDEATTKRQRRMARQPGSSASGTHEATAATKKPNKTDTVLALLNRGGGATLDELVEVTGWLPHSARAALTGLKKKGHAIERTKLDGVSHYAIFKPVSQ
jgi:hypothetical protein